MPDCFHILGKFFRSTENKNKKIQAPQTNKYSSPRSNQHPGSRVPPPQNKLPTCLTQERVNHEVTGDPGSQIEENNLIF